MARAVFLDKDGTLVPDTPECPGHPPDSLLPGVAQGLRLLARAHRKLVVVTNQAAVAFGRLTERDVLQAGEALRALLAPHEVALAGFYYCPHHAGGTIPRYTTDCSCRKPKPGLIEKACEDLGLVPEASFMI